VSRTAFPIDLRSDTVTTPTPSMRRAMAEAEVGDDVYGEDPTVATLQASLAEMTGFERGLFMPSGTMSNQVAIAAQVAPGSEIVCPEGSHIYEYEPGSLAVISGSLPRLVAAPAGVPDPSAVRAAIHDSVHQAPTGMISLENTHNRAGGTVVPLEVGAAVQAVAADFSLPIHLDGARAFNAAVALGVEVAAVCRGFTSASICLSKGLGAPVGSVLLASEAVIRRAHRWRKMLGGGMRQAGVLAAAGLVALQEGPARLADDHRRARYLAEGLARAPGVEVDLASVMTNLVYLRVARAKEFVAASARRGVLVNALGAGSVRLVTHHQVTDEQAEEALAALVEAAAEVAEAADSAPARAAEPDGGVRA